MSLKMGQQSSQQAVSGPLAPVDATSRSVSPTDSKSPLWLVRLAADAQRDLIYKDRANAFKAGLSEEAYFRKMRYPYSTKHKTVWALVTADSLDQPRASIEVHARDIFFRAAPDAKVSVRQAVYLSALYVPKAHRGNGHARQLLHRVLASLRSGHFPVPLNDVALVYAATEPGSERIYRTATWHPVGKAIWSTASPPQFDKLGPLPMTEPIFEKDLAGLSAIATARAKRAINQSRSQGPCFTFIPDEDSIRMILAHYRLNWKFGPRASSERPVVIGARVGSLQAPDGLSFTLWGFMESKKGVYILNLSSVDDRHSLALCAAATEASRALSGESVHLKLQQPGALASVIDFTTDTSQTGHRLEGTQLLDPDLESSAGVWIDRTDLDFTPFSGN